MKDDQIDQTNAYSEYFEAVRNFNRANDEYIQIIDQIANNRKLAIQKAIEIQINPVLSRARAIQSWSGFAIFLSIVFLVIGLNLASPSASSSQVTGSTAQAALGTLLVLGSLGTGILSVIVLAWASTKISKLNLSVYQVQERTNNPSIE